MPGLPGTARNLACCAFCTVASSPITWNTCVLRLCCLLSSPGRSPSSVRLSDGAGAPASRPLAQRSLESRPTACSLPLCDCGPVLSPCVHTLTEHYYWLYSSSRAFHAFSSAMRNAIQASAFIHAIPAGFTALITIFRAHTALLCPHQSSARAASATSHPSTDYTLLCHKDSSSSKK